MVFSTDHTQAILGTVADFAAVAHQVKNDDLRAWSEKTVLETIFVVERHSQTCIKFLLETLRASVADAAVAHDAIWMLWKMAHRSELARAWILEAGGAEAIQSALVTHAFESRLIEDGVWLVFALDGIRGLGGLLCASGGALANHVAVRTAVAWAVFELVKGERAECCAQPRPESSSLLTLLVETLDHDSTSPDAQWACIAALEAIVKGEPSLGIIFIQHRGSRLLVSALRAAAGMGTEGENFRRAVAYLMAALADGNHQAAEALRADGALQVLSEEGLCGNGRDTEGALWALGSLGGLSVLLPAVNKHCLHRPDVVRGGIVAICECAWNAAGNAEELQRLPLALNIVLELLRRSDGHSDDAAEHIRALGCVAANLAPHFPPSTHPDVDRGVEALFNTVSVESKRWQATSSSPSPTSRRPASEADDAPWPLAETSIEALGNVALAAPAWREALRRCGALDVLQQWLGAAPQKPLLKCLLKAAAGIAGMPLIISELQRHLQRADIVDIALCTLVEVGEDDHLGKHSLEGVAWFAESDMPSVLRLVLEAMRTHPGDVDVQSRGCRCVSLLLASTSLETELNLASQLVVAVLAAARRFPRRLDVVQGMCESLRELCSLLRPHANASTTTASEALVATLRAEGAVDCIQQVIDDYGSGTAAPEGASTELLEDAVVVLTMLLGVEVALTSLAASSPGSTMRCAGLKGVYEACRSDMTLLSGGVSSSTVEAVSKMMAEEPEDLAGRLPQVAALLAGVCGGTAARAPLIAATPTPVRTSRGLLG